MLSLVYCTDARLNQISTPVDVFDENLSLFVDEMYELLSLKGGVGLAAVQVGSPIRLFITDTGEDGGKRVFVNPNILGTSDDSEPYNEGCLSIPRVYRDIYRPSKVIVQAYDLNGKKFTLKADGLLARVIQHESDHLDGKLFISHLTDDEERRAIKEFKKENRFLIKHIRKEKG